jgi:AraC-like DNA-binding protein
MVYLECRPSLPLAAAIRSLWYARAPEVPPVRERVLPNGCIQIVISLAADALTDCDGDVLTPLPAAILVGARGRYDVVHTRDMAELVGIVFRPGGLGPWLRQPADRFFEQSVSLDDVWPVRDLRDRLRAVAGPSQKLALLDSLLVERLGGRELRMRPAVLFALAGLRCQSVRQSAQAAGLSERRLHQIFREDAGLSPKLWSRIYRFQRAVRGLHSGTEARWDRLALDCGYFDQSHFSNDFRAFSGIDPTTYSGRRGRWQNHVRF